MTGAFQKHSGNALRQAISRVGLMGLVLCSFASFAQTAPSIALEVQQISQAGNHAGQAQDWSCQTKNYVAQDRQTKAVYWPKQVQALSLNNACWVGAEQVAEAMTSITTSAGGTAKPVLVDVRPHSLQKSAPVANALQLEITDLANKKFLQQEPVVLIGTGLDYITLSQTCQQLHQQGFSKVQAVRGGVKALRTALAVKQSTNQQTTAAAHRTSLQIIEANDWIASLGQGVQWTVISISGALQYAPAEHLPVPVQQLVTVRVDGKSNGKDRDEKLIAAAGRAVNDAVKKHMNSSGAQAIVVIPDASMGDAFRLQLEHAFSQATAPAQTGNVAASPASLTTATYWLQGGWQGYEQQVTQTAAIQQTASHRLQVPCGRI
ncbi:MAG: rhodanese-like domain-containing protein [Comamonas sp.]|uniref:rhodanese-like domain-containing protein n=1 Tax=Comamonas sp. TaxID=34028 RepID=UPI002FC856C7